MPGPGDNKPKESQGLRDLYEKIQQAEPNETPFGAFVARLKSNPSIGDTGMNYRDVIREKFKHYYGDEFEPQQFNEFVEGNLSYHEKAKGRPVFTSRDEMVNYFGEKQDELQQKKASNPYPGMDFPVMEDHGGDPYMGYYPDGTPADPQLAANLENQFKMLSNPKMTHDVWNQDVKRKQEFLNPSNTIGIPGSDAAQDFEMPDFGNFNYNQMDKEALQRYTYDLEQELRQQNSQAADEVQKKLTEMYSSENYDPVEIRDYLKNIHGQYDLDPNNSDYNFLLESGDYADPEMQKQRQAKIKAANASAEYFTKERDALIEKAERIRELNDIENEVLGGVELTDYEKALLTEELADLNKDISMFQSQIKNLRDKNNDQTLGMSPEEKVKHNAEQNVIDEYKKEWGDVLEVYGISPYNSSKMKDIQWPEEVGASIEKSMDDFLNDMQELDYDEFVRMSGKSEQELLKDYAYRRFWPEFKQMVKNYDPGVFTNIIGTVLGDWSEGATLTDVAEKVDLSGMKATGGEPEEEYVRDMIQKAVLLYYMANEGKDPTTFFGKGDEWGSAGIIPGINPVTQPVIRGAHEGAMGFTDFVGLEGLQSSGATIRDDLRRKSTVSSDVIELFSNAGINTPENIRSWSRPSNWERVQDIVTDVSQIGYEFAVFDVATGGIGSIGGLSKLGSSAKAITKGSRLANMGLRTEAGLTKIAGEMTNFIKSAETIAATSKNPMARFWAKRALQGGNAIKEGVKYELVGQIFGDERLDFTSGVAGYFGKSAVTSLFPKVSPGLKQKALNFFGKGAGEIGEETLQEISQQGFDKFMQQMSDPTERTWFLATSFILGGVMGGTDSKLQDMAMQNYANLDSEQKAKFDEMTGRVEFQKMSKNFKDEARLSPLAKEIRAKLKPNMTPEQVYEVESMSDAASEQVINELEFPVSDRASQSIKAENRKRMLNGQDLMSKPEMVEELSTPEDVSQNYSKEMPVEERVSQLQQDIEAIGYQRNNVYDEIQKLPDGQTKTMLNQAYEKKEKSRSKMFEDIKRGIDSELSADVELNIDPTETQGKWDEIQENFGLNTVRKKFQDQDIYLKKFIERIRKAGGKVDDAVDTYLQMSLSAGKVSAKRFDVLNKTLSKKNPNSIMSRLDKEGISEEDFGKFLYSLNAKEKNASLREKHGEDTDLNSGMTDEQADAIQRSAKESGNFDTYMELQEEFKRTVIDPIIDEKYNAGVLDTVEYEALKNSYEYYVPTKVDAVKIGFDEGFKEGGGFKSKGIKGLEGSNKISFEERYNPFFKAIDDNIASIISSERNNNIRSFADLLRANNLLGSKFKISDKSGETSAAHTIEFFENGIRKYLQVMDKEIGRSLDKGNLRDSDIAQVVQWVQPLVRFKRMTSTMRNPAFIPTNFMRDFGMAYWRLGSLGIKGVNPAQYTNTVRKSIGSMPKILKDIKNGKTPSGEYGELYQEALSAGAITTYADFVKSEGRFADLQREAKLYAKDPTMVKRFWDFTTEWIETVSNYTEQGVRLATYKLARDSGMSTDRSASAAREVTLNFDRKGTLSWVTNTMYMFSNAGIQGSYNLLSTLTKKGEMEVFGKKIPVSSAQMMSAGIFTASILLNMLNDSVGDDEDNDSIRDFDRDKNLIFINPFSKRKGDYVKVPIPQGLNIVKAMGDSTYDLLTGRTDEKSVIEKSIKLMTESFSPLQGGTAIQALSPTFLDPFVQVMENKNYFGGQLAPTDKFGQGERVRAYQKFSNATVVGDFFAKKMNQLTGGSKVERGLIDYSPNVYDTYFQFIYGGTGKFYAQGIMSIYDAFEGEFSLEESKPPVISSFIRYSTPYSGYKTKVYEMRSASSATEMTPEDYDNLQTMLDKLVRSQEMDPDKASKIMKTVRRNQVVVRFAKENDMTFDEARNFMKDR